MLFIDSTISSLIVWIMYGNKLFVTYFCPSSAFCATINVSLTVSGQQHRIRKAFNRTLPFASLNWLNACAIRGTTVLAPNHVLINGLPSGSNYLTNTGTARLAINAFEVGQDRGEFEFGCVIIFDQPLTGFIEIMNSRQIICISLNTAIFHF